MYAGAETDGLHFVSYGALGTAAGLAASAVSTSCPSNTDSSAPPLPTARNGPTS